MGQVHQGGASHDLEINGTIRHTVYAYTAQLDSNDDEA